MNDEELLAGLRTSAKRASRTATGTDLDAPLGAAFEERVTARILAEHGVAAREQEACAPAPRAPLNLARLHRFPLRSAFAGFAAAAVLLLTLSHPWRGPAGLELPAYTATVTGQQDTTRSAEAAPGAPVAATADAPLTIVLRPPSDVSEPLDVHVFALRGGKASEAHPQLRVSPSGSVEVKGTARSLVGAAPGDCTLVVVIGRVGARSDAQAIAEGANPPRGVTVTRIPVQLLP